MEAAFKDAEIEQEAEEFKKGDAYQEKVDIQMDDEQVVEKGSVVTSTARGGPMWNRETGVMSMVLTDQAKLRLGQIFPMDHPTPEFRDQRVYTITPMELVNPGKMKCKLHREHPARKTLDQWFKGQHCPKHNMLTQLDVDNHFEHKHKGEFKVVEDDEERRHKAAMLEMQRLQMESMQAIAKRGEVPEASTSATVSAIPGLVEKSDPATAIDPPTFTPADESCPEEGCDYQGTAKQVQGHKMGAHKEVKAATP